MQKTKSKFLLSTLLILFLALTLSVAYVRPVSARENKANLEMVFPDENPYVNIESPTKIAISGSKVAIFDEKLKKIFVKGRFFNPISVNDALFSLQISENYVAYLENNSIVIKTLDGKDYTDTLAQLLTENGIEPSRILAYYLTNDAIYVLNNGYLYQITIQDGFVLSKPEKINEDADLLRAENIKIIDGAIYYINDKTLFKIENKNKSVITKFTDNIEYTDDKTIIEYNSYGIRNSTITNEELKVYEFTDLKISDKIMLIADKGTGTVKEYDLEQLLQGKVVITAEYGNKGNDVSKLNGPKQVVEDNGKTYVLDSNNLAVKDITDIKNVKCYKLQDVPTAFTVNNDVIYYSTSTSLITRSIATEEEKTYPYENITDIKAYKNGILYLSNEQAYRFDEGKSTPLNLDNVDNISANKNGSFIYVKNGINIEKYLGNHKITLNLQNAKIGGIIDFEVDAHGNIFVLYTDEIGVIISYFTNDGSSISTTPVTITLAHATYKLQYVTDLAIVNNALYITDENLNAIFKVTSEEFNGLIDNTKNETPQVPSGLLDELTAYKVPSNTLLYAHSNNCEIASLVENETIVWAFFDVYDSKKFVLCGDKYGVIENKYLTKVEKTPINKIAQAKHGNYTMYRYPLVNDDVKIPDPPESITVISEVKGFNNGFTWYEVEYKGKRAFVVQDELMLIADVKPPEITYSYMIVKSSSIGVPVKMYAEPNENSHVVKDLKDGDKVTVIENCGEFVKVRFDGFEGYVLKVNLINEGLTQNQIIAIVISVVTVVVAIIIFIYTMSMRKKQREE